MVTQGPGLIGLAGAVSPAAGESRPAAGRGTRGALLRVAAAAVFACASSCAAQPVMPADSRFPGDASASTSRLAEATGFEARVRNILGLMEDAVARMEKLSRADAEVMGALAKSFARLAEEGLMKSLRAGCEAGEDVVFAARAAEEALVGMEDALLCAARGSPAASAALDACRKALFEARALKNGD